MRIGKSNNAKWGATFWSALPYIVVFFFQLQAIHRPGDSSSVHNSFFALVKRKRGTHFETSRENWFPYSIVTRKFFQKPRIEGIANSYCSISCHAKATNWAPASTGHAVDRNEIWSNGLAIIFVLTIALLNASLTTTTWGQTIAKGIEEPFTKWNLCFIHLWFGKYSDNDADEDDSRLANL